MNKTCMSCHESQQPRFFSKSLGCCDGLQDICKECMKKRIEKKRSLLKRSRKLAKNRASVKRQARYDDWIESGEIVVNKIPSNFD